jgi:hypothetical protein
MLFPLRDFNSFWLEHSHTPAEMQLPWHDAVTTLKIKNILFSLQIRLKN